MSVITEPSALLEYLSTADAAALLHLTPGAVSLAARLGRLRVAAITRRGQRLYTVDDVEAFGRRRNGCGGGVAHVDGGTN